MFQVIRPNKPGTWNLKPEISTSFALTLLLFLACARPPVITSLTANPNPVAPGGTSVVRALAHSPQGEDLTYYWYLVENGIGSLDSPAGDSILYHAPKLANTCHIAVRVLDSDLHHADDTLLMEIGNAR
jgi:hypothetical protein